MSDNLIPVERIEGAILLIRSQKVMLDKDLATLYGVGTKVLIQAVKRNLQRFPDSKPGDDWGIRPDAGRELPVTPDLSKRLREWHVLQVLRPAGDRTALPLDDPDNDPQRQAALQMLRAMLHPKSS